MADPDLPLRRAVRALMIDHSDRVLMIKLDIARSGWVGWVLPGGGIEGDEEMRTALARELREETGLRDPFIGPVVCRRVQRGPLIAPGFGGQEDQIHLVPCHDFALEPMMSAAALQAEGIVDMRWFTPTELQETADMLVPEGLADLVDRVLEFGGSIDPLVIEVFENDD